jgi:outer membrane lipoprotein-sorting protein
MRIKKAFATGLLALAPALTGCLSHTHSVIKTRPPDVVLNADLNQLLQQIDERYAQVQSMQATIEITYSTGGSMQGAVKEHTSLNGNGYSGYIVLGKPENIRVIVLFPVVRTDMIDMVSDGARFKMRIPPEHCAIVGSDVVKNSSQKGIYSLRPAMILDSLMIKGLQPDQLVTLTHDSRPGYPDPKKRKQLIVEPDYDIGFLSQPQGNVARSLRVVHISRANLLPWRQDIYNADGRIETQAFYDSYKTFGDIKFPTKIRIERPLDELSLNIAITKDTFNQKPDADSFTLDIPENYTVTNMDDPASAATVPCVAHATQSPH